LTPRGLQQPTGVPSESDGLLRPIGAGAATPEGANPVRVESMHELGAEVILSGADQDEAREHYEALGEERSCGYVHSGNEPQLIASVGTKALEILDDRPDLDVIIVPVGGGSGAAGVPSAAASFLKTAAIMYQLR